MRCSGVSCPSTGLLWLERCSKLLEEMTWALHQASSTGDFVYAMICTCCCWRLACCWLTWGLLFANFLTEWTELLACCWLASVCQLLFMLLVMSSELWTKSSVHSVVWSLEYWMCWLCELCYLHFVMKSAWAPGHPIMKFNPFCDENLFHYVKMLISKLWRKWDPITAGHLDYWIPATWPIKSDTCTLHVSEHMASHGSTNHVS